MLASRRLATLSLGLALLAPLGLAGGCSSDSGSGGFRITQPQPVHSTAPVPDSPENLLRLLEWCYANRDLETYRTLFTEDFRFVFATLDPNGNAYRSIPWIREDEIESFAHLVNGGDANQPRAQSITLMLDRNFRVTDDPRPGMMPTWHRMIRTSATLRIVADPSQWEIFGFANFFVVRGDSAAIPPDLKARGFGPDPQRWYIQRWEDDTSPPEGARAMPTSKSTWGSIKAIYR